MPTIRKNGGAGSVVSKQANRASQNRRRSDVAVPGRYRNRPSPVRVAIYRVWERSADLGFTRATTRVLQAIIAAGVSADKPFNSVFAKKATLASLADCSEVTVYRAMNQLEKEGWIQREHQERLDDGMLDIGHIKITEKLAVLIGFVESITSNMSSVDDNCGEQSIDQATNDRGHIDGQPDQIDESMATLKAPRRGNEGWLDKPDQGDPSTEMKHGMTDGPIYRGEQMVYPKASVNNQSTRKEFVRMDGRAVAQELVWLITEGKLTYGQLFKLQRLAKQIPGQELSDFVAYRSERLKQLTTTNDCYRYLKKFIDDGIDARYLCAQRAKMQHRTKRTTQRKKVEDVVCNWAKSFDGRTLVSAKTGKAYLVHAQSGTIEIVREGVPANISMKIDRRFMRAVQAGELALQNISKANLAIMISPTPCRRTEEEFQRAETSIARMKAMLKGSACKIQTIAK